MFKHILVPTDGSKLAMKGAKVLAHSKIPVLVTREPGS
jgi:nucleotide-binding universal stress UspA family protein